MVILSIDEATLPDGTSATSQAGGGTLPDATTYYYRIATVNDTGEVCACVSFSETTTAANDSIVLVWTDVATAKSSNGYKIYRNTSDAWTSGSLLLATDSGTPYTDTGSATGAGLPVTFTADITFPRVLSGPAMVTESSRITESQIPGKEGGITQVHGGPSDILTLTGILKGSTAKTDLDKLRAFRHSGTPHTFTIIAHTITWIDEDFIISRISWAPDVGTPSVAGGAWVNYILELVQYV